ncbi:hypothetical protein SRABI26_02811 [Arthrobacter sp. Bi26]|nr:hypothetical protein SRABI26_02811 [Arthrobacter sp. Bi26]
MWRVHGTGPEIPLHCGISGLPRAARVGCTECLHGTAMPMHETSRGPNRATVAGAAGGELKADLKNAESILIRPPDGNE